MTAAVEPSVALTFAPGSVSQRELAELGLARQIVARADKPRVVIQQSAIASRLFIIKNALERLKSGDIDSLDAVSLAQVAHEAWKLYYPTYLRHASEAFVQAYTKAFEAAGASVDQKLIRALAMEHVRKTGDYFHQTSVDALVQGFTGMVNRKVPPRIAAARVVEAYGLTPRQMSGLVAMEAPGVVRAAVPIDLKARVRNYIGVSLKQRLKVFSGQEEHNLSMQAAQTAWLWMVENGSMSATAEKIWITEKDERVCKICGPMHGMTVPVTQQFETDDGDKLWVPGAHVNCRCWVRIREPLKNHRQPDRPEVRKSYRTYERNATGQFGSTTPLHGKPGGKTSVATRTRDDGWLDSLLREVQEMKEAQKVEVSAPAKFEVGASQRFDVTPEAAPPAVEVNTAPPKFEIATDQLERVDVSTAAPRFEIATDDSPQRFEVGSADPVQIPKKTRRVRGTAPISIILGDNTPAVYRVIGTGEEGYDGHYQLTSSETFETSLDKALEQAELLRDELVNEALYDATQGGDETGLIPVHALDSHIQGYTKLRPEDAWEALTLASHGSVAFVDVDLYDPESGAYLDHARVTTDDLVVGMGTDPENLRVSVAEIREVHWSMRGNAKVDREPDTVYGDSGISVTGDYHTVSTHTEDGVTIALLEPLDPEEWDEEE